MLPGARQSSVSLVNKYHELQIQVQDMQNARDNALRKRNDLRQELHETRRIQAISRKKQDLVHQDRYESLRTTIEEGVGNVNQLRSALASLTACNAQLQEKRGNQLARQNILQDDIRRCEAKVRNSEQRVLDLQQALLASQGRVATLEKRLGMDAVAQERAIQVEIQRIQQASEKEHLASVRADIRLGALESYLEIILKVNGDLCDTISQRVDTDKRAIHLAERQMESSLRRHEKEVNDLLERAEAIGVQKATEVSRQVNWLSRPSTRPPIRTYSPGREDRKSVSFEAYNDIDQWKSRRSRRSNTSKKTMKRDRRSHHGSHHPRIYDTQLIEAAARMAATAAANSVVAANSTAHCSVCPPKNFIPPSARSNTEFNVIASVSKAARAAKSLNARVASK